MLLLYYSLLYFQSNTSFREKRFFWENYRQLYRGMSSKLWQSYQKKAPSFSFFLDLFKMRFFISYLANPRPNLKHWRGGNHIYLMLITAKLFVPKFTGSPTKRINGIRTKNFRSRSDVLQQSAFTCSKLTIETLEQDVKYVQS